MNPVSPPLRDVAARLIGPPPAALDTPCRYCGARPGGPCVWHRAPGAPVLHSVRADCWSSWRAAHGRLVAAVVAWAEAVAAGRPARTLELRARALHRALCRRAEGAGAAAPVLPSPAEVLAEASAGATL